MVPREQSIIEKYLYLWSGLTFHKTLTDTDLKSIIPHFISSNTVYVSFFKISLP